MGGAIYNQNGTIEKITGDKISGNYVSAKNTFGLGGAIYNTGKLGEINTKEISRKNWTFT